MMIDEGLVLPSVRANIEANCKRIALGTSTYDEVVGSTIADFKRRFERLVCVTQPQHRPTLALSLVLPVLVITPTQSHPHPHPPSWPSPPASSYPLPSHISSPGCSPSLPSFIRLAHRIPLMLAVALDPSVVGGRVDSSTAGGQLWVNAQNKVLS